MLIEIFTDGRIKIDGEAQDNGVKAEHLLKEYLLNPEGLARHPMLQVAGAAPAAQKPQKVARPVSKAA